METIVMNEKQTAEKILELAGKVQAGTERIVKIGTETSKTLTQVTDLKKQVADLQEIINSGNGGEVSQELKEAVDQLATNTDALGVQAQATDDLVPDETPAPAGPGE